MLVLILGMFELLYSRYDESVTKTKTETWNF